MSMSGHESARQQTETWLTPPEILAALGAFDLDPCCPPAMPWPTAKRMLTVQDDGLKQAWEGRVWCNPPWGNKAAPWMQRMKAHGNGIALLPARTETKAFFAHVWGGADAVLFVRGRPCFHRPDGTKAKANCGCPIALVAYGSANVEVLRASGLGVCVTWGEHGPRAG